MERGDLLYLIDLAGKHYPGEEPTADIMGKAHFREEQYWKRMEAAVQNAIARAFGEG